MTIIARFPFLLKVIEPPSWAGFCALNPLKPTGSTCIKVLWAALFIATASGCANLGSPPNVGINAIQNTAPEAKPKIAERPFPTDTLYSLMAAELAGKRQQYPLALRNYLHQAKKTKDPEVIKRAMQIARHLKSDKGILDAALLYHEIDPGNIEATRLAAIQLARANKLNESFELFVQLTEKNAPSQFDFLAAQIIRQKPPPTAEFLPLYQKLLHTQPNRKDLQLGAAVLYLASELPEPAMKLTEQVLAQQPHEFHAFQSTLLKNRILIAQKRFPEALNHIAAAVEHKPKDFRLRMQYIRLLLNEQQRLGRALASAPQNETVLREQFQQILLQNPRSPAIVINLASIAGQAGLNDIAALFLKQQISVGYNPAQAHYQLGQLAEAAGKTEEALMHYRLVDRGPLLGAVAAQANILIQQNRSKEAKDLFEKTQQKHPEQLVKIYQIEAELLAKHNQIDSAMAVIDRALDQFGFHVELLYSRSMLYERTGNMKLAETDLRKILHEYPNDSMALNALGYSLTVHTKRYDEALELITRALKLKPDEPAIIDSLGWLQYRMGSLEQSQQNLEKAYQQIKDPEVVAHLAEVLWVRGDKERASALLYDLLKARPGNSEALSVIRQFDIPKPILKPSADQ